jgi:tape measure domain-containing protein
MDEDDILIEVKLDDREITRQMDALGRKLQKSLDVALGGNRPGGGATAATRALKDQETAALKLAQAQARLATASGDLTKAQTTLNTALAGVNKTTIASISAQTQLAQVHQRMARNLKDMADTLTNIGARLTIGISAPIAALGIAAIKTATDFDSLKRGLIAVSGSSENAERQLVRLKEVAKLPGLGFREAIQGSINLQAAGLSAERSERALKAFGNALATVGKGKTELDGVILALSQIESKGKVSAEEINQLAERVPQIRQIMIRAFGTADTEVIQKAKITSRQFIDTVVAELEKLPKVTGGARNTFENLKDSIEQSLLPLGNKLLSTILPAIEKLSPKILGLLESFGKLSPTVQTLAIGFGAAAFAAGPLISAVSNLTSAVLALNSAGLGAGLANLARLGLIGAGAATAGFLAAKAIDKTIINPNVSQKEIEERAKQMMTRDPSLSFPLALNQAQRAILADRANAAGLQASRDDALRRKLANEARVEEKARRFAAGEIDQFGNPIASKTIDANALAKQNAKGQAQKSELDKARDTVKSLTEKLAALGTEESRLGVELAKINLIREKIRLLQEPIDRRNDRQARIELGLPIPETLPNIGITDARRRAIGLPVRGNPLLGGSPLGGIVSRENREEISANIADAARSRGELADQRLRIQEVQIQNQLNRGLLTEADAQRALNAARRAGRDELIASLEQEQKAVGLNSMRGLQIAEEIERLRFLGVELSSTERFMRGFNSAVESVGDAFERFGQNVSRALANTKDLLNGLKNSVLQLFNDIIGQGLQNLVRNALGPLVGLGGGGISGAAGGIGNIFRTPSTFPAQFAQAFASAAGGGISTPASISSQGATGIFANGAFAAGLTGGDSGGAIGATGGIGRIPGLSRVLGGVFNRVFAGGAVSAFPPLLGASLGAGLGGQSTLGRILGGIGGSAVGLGVGFGSAVLSAGGGLGQAALAALGPAALIGAPLLVGAILLGRAKQRKKDEEASGQFLTQALQAIDQLAAGIVSGQVLGSQARNIFDTQILNPFKQQIGGLKTKSVRESRLTNQVRDLENQYQDRIVPLIAQQAQRRDLSSRLIPEFATGGRMPFDGLARLHRDELIISPRQQTPELLLAAAAAQVPNVDRSAPAPAAQPVTNVTYVIGTQEQSEIIVNGLRQQAGNKALKNEVNKLIKYEELG